MSLPKGWETYGAVVAAMASLVWMRPDFYKDVTGEIITLFGLVMAAVIPTMLLAATALRAGNFSVMRLRHLSQAVSRMVSLFGGLFVYAMFGSVILIIAKTQAWTIPVIPTGLSTSPTLNPSGVFAASVTFVMVFLTLRSLAFIAGAQSILRLISALAEDEAQARDRLVVSPDAEELRSYRTPPGHGERIEIQH